MSRRSCYYFKIFCLQLYISLSRGFPNQNGKRKRLRNVDDHLLEKNCRSNIAMKEMVLFFESRDCFWLISFLIYTRYKKRGNLKIYFRYIPSIFSSSKKGNARCMYSLLRNNNIFWYYAKVKQRLWKYWHQLLNFSFVSIIYSFKTFSFFGCICQYPFSKTLKKGFDSSSVIFSSDL